MIKIEGVIGEDYSYSMFVAALTKETENVVTVSINSIGGYVDTGLLIYNHLLELKQKGYRIITRSVNECMSIASIVFMAGDERQIGCPLMIHNPWAYANGDANELKRLSKEIEAVEKQLENIYAEHTGQSVEVISRFMDQETYLMPQEALDLNFATSILAQARAQKRRIESKPKVIFNQDVKLNLEKMAKPNEKKSWLERAKAWKEKALGGIKNIQYPTVDGGVLELEKEDGAPEIGDVSISPDGTYELDNGLTVVVTDGLVSAVETEATPEEMAAQLDEAEEVIDGLIADLEAAQANQMTPENKKIVDAVKAAGGIEKIMAGKTKSTYRPTPKAGKSEAGSRYSVTDRDAKIEAIKNRKNQKSLFGK